VSELSTAATEGVLTVFDGETTGPVRSRRWNESEKKAVADVCQT